MIGHTKTLKQATRPRGAMGATRHCEGYIFQHREMRPQGEILEHHAKAAPFGRDEYIIRVINQGGADVNGAMISPVKPADEAQQAGFARAGFARQHQTFALSHIQGDGIQNPAAGDFATQIGDGE
jgi:hypothetical protein